MRSALLLAALLAVQAAAAQSEAPAETAQQQLPVHSLDGQPAGSEGGAGAVGRPGSPDEPIGPKAEVGPVPCVAGVCPPGLEGTVGDVFSHPAFMAFRSPASHDRIAVDLDVVDPSPAADPPKAAEESEAPLPVDGSVPGRAAEAALLPDPLPLAEPPATGENPTASPQPLPAAEPSPWAPASSAARPASTPGWDRVMATLGVAAALAFLAAAWTLARRALGLPALALFSRLTRDSALGHRSRQDLLAAIRRSPGATLMQAARLAGTSRNNAAYHLGILERHGLVHGTKLGRFRHYFLEPSPDRPHVALLRVERRRRVADFILANPGCIQKEISCALGIVPSRVNAHVRQLVSAGLVQALRSGRGRTLRASQRLEHVRSDSAWSP